MPLGRRTKKGSAGEMGDCKGGRFSSFKMHRKNLGLHFQRGISAIRCFHSFGKWKSWRKNLEEKPLYHYTPSHEFFSALILH